MDDPQLVQRMRSGDERAFDEFFDAYFPRLFHFAVRRLGNEDAAEDVVQAALIIATRKIGTWRGEAALFTWLCTICRHELSAYWARTGRQPVTLPLDDHPDIRAQIESLAHEGRDRTPNSSDTTCPTVSASRSIICLARMATCSPGSTSRVSRSSRSLNGWGPRPRRPNPC